MSQDTLNNMLHFGWDMFSGEVIMSLIVMLIICIISFVIYFKFKKLDPTKPDKGFTMIVETLVEKLESFTVELMGERRRSFSGYALGLAIYIILCFLVSLIGFPGPLSYLGNTFSIALCINLLSMWAPLLSLALRLFGNALAGFTLMSIVYYALGNVSSMLFSFIPGGWSSIILPPFITPILHLYFDVFSGLIQTLIFVMLTMIFIAQEDPEEEEVQIDLSR